MNNDQLSICIKNLNIIVNFEMLILHFALIFEKGKGRDVLSPTLSYDTNQNKPQNNFSISK